MTKRTKDQDQPLATYHLSHAQATTILKSAEVPVDELRAVTPEGTVVGATHQKHGAIGKVVRHYMKWLPTDESTTTIPLTPAELAELHEHLPRTQRLQEV